MSTSNSQNSDDELVERIANIIVESGMEVPATLFLEFGKISGMTHSFTQIAYGLTSWLFGLHPYLAQHNLEIMKLTANSENIKRILDRIEEKHNNKKRARIKQNKKDL